jgi:hypothetical protein
VASFIRPLSSSSRPICSAGSPPAGPAASTAGPGPRQLILKRPSRAFASHRPLAGQSRPCRRRAAASSAPAGGVRQLGGRLLRAPLPGALPSLALPDGESLLCDWQLQPSRSRRRAAGVVWVGQRLEFRETRAPRGSRLLAAARRGRALLPLLPPHGPAIGAPGNQHPGCSPLATRRQQHAMQRSRGPNNPGRRFLRHLARCQQCMEPRPSALRKAPTAHQTTTPQRSSRPLQSTPPRQ